MQTRRFTRLPGMILAVMLTLLVGSARADEKQITGTWIVTITFPVCSAECPCPPATSVPGLHRYLQDGSMLEVGNPAARSTGLGAWEHIDHHQFVARFAFITANGSREDVTTYITLTAPDAFTSNSIFDLFGPTGNRISPPDGCPREETATRFE